MPKNRFFTIVKLAAGALAQQAFHNEKVQLFIIALLNALLDI
jgi:hypothetical protein